MPRVWIIADQGNNMIRGEKVILRTVREADIEELYALVNDVQNRGEFLTGELLSEIDFKNLFLKHGFWGEDEGFLLICVENKIVGRVGYSRTMPYFDALEVWYGIFDPADRNKGYTTEAISLLVRYLFSTRKINRLQLVADAMNGASKRVAEKCGFKFEGTARKALFNRGEHRDMDIFSVLRGEVNLRDVS
jgi:RimJ/RimL family protein N-acetyltransferase